MVCEVIRVRLLLRQIRVRSVSVWLRLGCGDGVRGVDCDGCSDLCPVLLTVMVAQICGRCR